MGGPGQRGEPELHHIPLPLTSQAKALESFGKESPESGGDMKSHWPLKEETRIGLLKFLHIPLVWDIKYFALTLF